MDKVYHYTKIQNVDSIIKNDAIRLLSTFFRKYDKGDYLWIKNCSKDVIKEICIENKWTYDEEELTLKPYFISFCQDKNSSYMWKHYADEGKGVKLVFNKELLKACDHLNPNGNGGHHLATEATLPCIYIEDKSSLKQQLLDNINIEDLQPWDYFDRLRFLASAIKQARLYKEEREYRHIHLYPIAFAAEYNEGNFYFMDDEGLVEGNDMRITVLFPKEMLVGIELGSNTTQKEFCQMRNYMMSIGYSPDIVTRMSSKVKSK